jgi:hypothetical protein
VSLKWVEVLVLVCAGALFVGWQWRDLRRAREHSRKQREAQALNAANQAQMEVLEVPPEPQKPHER